ncbi:hypothetical protein G4V62_07480 [Bacillaceae bacterium SIJ1]|uniref:DUF6583 family protein n=1 Tax=Litoribacterium kuwaitense TaxID=1398745 RepID=UPI0013ED4790|nr:DUF6583 family protein [Litoribacterium kuwaitense]NGP44806.1 hypothetical protein [Litoribacterium kuwaitense]
MTSRKKTDERIIQQEVAATTEPGAQRTSKKPKIWMIAVALIVVILGTVGLTLAMQSSDSPKNAFFTAESKALEDFKEDFNERFGDYVKYSQKSSTEPLKMSMGISGSVEASGEMANSPDVQMAKAMLDSASLQINMGQNYEAEELYGNLEVLMGDSPLFSGEFTQTADIIGISVPDFYEEYLYVPNDQFGEFMTKLDPTYSGPEQLNVASYLMTDYREFLPTDEEWDHILKSYGKDYFYEQLKEEQFTMKENVKFEHAGTSMDVKEVTLNLTPEEVKPLFVGYLEKMRDDEKVKAMIERQMEHANEVIIQQGQLEGFDPEMAGMMIPTEEVLNDWETSIDEMITDLEESPAAPGLTYTIKVNDENIVDRHIELSDDTESMVLHTQNIETGKDATYHLVDMTVNDENGLKLETEGAATENGYEETTTITLKDAATGDMSAQLDGSYPEADDAPNTYTLTFNDPTTGDPVTLSLDHTFNFDKKAGTVNEKIDLNFNADFIMPGMTLGLLMDINTEFTEDIGLPDPTQGTNVAELSDEEFQQIMIEMQTNAGLFLEQFMGGMSAF